MPSSPVHSRALARSPVEVAGMGLFTGRTAIVRIVAAAPGTGIRFRRADFAGAPEIPAHIDAIAQQAPGIPPRNTSLGRHPASVMTVEHVLSALVGLGIHGALLELDGPELPIGDGSAAHFVEAILRAGLIDSGAEPPALLTIERDIVVEAGGARIIASPRHEPGCFYRYDLDFGGGPISPQSASFVTGDAAAYAREIAPARTFCLQAEAEAMRAMGLFTNLSPRDMLVFGESGPIDNTLRFDNEPARHKLLDLIGDLALAGRPLQLNITATRSGHALNHELARALAAAGSGGRF